MDERVSGSALAKEVGRKVMAGQKRLLWSPVSPLGASAMSARAMLQNLSQGLFSQWSRASP